jgi:hypothetical protein
MRSIIGSIAEVLAKLGDLLEAGVRLFTGDRTDSVRQGG